MNTLSPPMTRRRFVFRRVVRQFREPLTILTFLLLVPTLTLAQSGGTPFDTGFTALQNLFTGTIAKVASLIAIVIGGYQFAHGEPGAKKSAEMQQRSHGASIAGDSAMTCCMEQIADPIHQVLPKATGSFITTP